MLQAFIIVSREALESFLIVAITLSYLKKTKQDRFIPSVYAGIATSLVASVGLGYVLINVVNQALWEGILGIVAIVMVVSLVLHMRRVGPQLKPNMEKQLGKLSAKSSFWAAAGIFFFIVLMISREGMETALMLFQVRRGGFTTGAAFGLLAAGVIAWLWVRVGHLINLKRFFQITEAFLWVFIVQIGIYSFHELCEAGVFPQSEFWHTATEPYSPDGMYGKWFSLIMVTASGAWLIVVAVREKIKNVPNKIKER